MLAKYLVIRPIIILRHTTYGLMYAMSAKATKSSFIGLDIYDMT